MFLAQAGLSGALRGAQGAVFGSYQGIPSAQVRARSWKVHPGSLPHESDGLIFNFSNRRARCPCSVEALLKWKFPELNSVDFLLRVSRGNGLLFVGEKGGQYARLEDEFVSRTDPLDTLDGKIVECWWDMEA